MNVEELEARVAELETLVAKLETAAAEKRAQHAQQLVFLALTAILVITAL